VKVAILACFNELYAPIADVALPVLKRYAEKHGYGVHVGEYHTDPTKLKTYGDRLKLELYKMHYDDHDILMFLDIDALVMNSEVRIEDVLGEFRPFLWTWDLNGPCSGFWIARCVPEVLLFLTAVAERAPRMGGLIAREELGPPHSVTLQMEPHGTSDQTAMTALMNIPPFDLVAAYCVSGKEAGHCYDVEALKIPPMFHYINAYAPGDWICTWPSLPLDERLALMKAASEKAT
jgi:hypothetical protein